MKTRSPDPSTFFQRASHRRTKARTLVDNLMRGLFTLMLGGFAVMLIVVGAQELITQRKIVATAEPVDATILSAKVVSAESVDTDASLNRDNSTTSYTPEVRFEYGFRGVRYESDLLYPSIIQQGWASQASAAEQIAEYEVGANVIAYVDASLPERGFLKLESSSGPTWFIIIGVICLALLAMLLRFL